MAKKHYIEIGRDDQLKTIDDELDAAMGNLDNTNQRIDEVLTSFSAGGLDAVDYAEGDEPAHEGGEVVETAEDSAGEEDGADEEYLDEDEEEDEFDEDDEDFEEDED